MNSFVQYLGDGTTTTFTVPFSYLSPSHVKVSLDGVQTAFSWNSGSVVVVPAPASGVIVDIRRETPLDDPLTGFTNGQVILEEGLDQLALVDLYRHQESVERSLTLATTGAYSAGNRRITNVGSPVSPTDAVTKQWVESSETSHIADLLAAKDEAEASASAAAASVTAAQGAASDAASSATNAANSATAAATSASNAATSEANAASSASAAATSATNAANSATAAAGSATNSANSASAAANSASAAAASASDANTAKLAAEAALDAFDDRYLGSKASDPTLDNDGNALINGALYWNTTMTPNRLRVYSGGIWVDASSISAGGGTWGSITGTLSNQTDLQTALDGKLPTSGGTLTGNLMFNAVGGERSVGWNFTEAQPVYFFGRDSDNVVGLYDGNLANSRFTTDASGNFTAAGDVTAFSDARLKTNVRTILGALDLVDRLRGVRFKKHGKESIGVIAQETQAVLPEVVMENSDGILSVAYGNIVGVLIEAIKELRAEIEELKRR